MVSKVIKCTLIYIFQGWCSLFSKTLFLWSLGLKWNMNYKVLSIVVFIISIILIKILKWWYLKHKNSVLIIS